MAILFDDASSEYYSLDSNPVTDEPLSISLWFNVDNFDVDQVLVDIGVDSSNRFMMMLNNSPSEEVRAYTGSVKSAKTSTEPTVNTWHHAGAVWASDSLREIWLDGGGYDDETTSVSVSGITTTNIGANLYGGGGYVSGAIAELAIWNAALTEAEIVMLANGVSPLLVRPGSLVYYHPMVRDTDVDLVGGIGLTESGSPTVTDHPPVFYPGPVSVGWAASGGVDNLTADEITCATTYDDPTAGHIHNLTASEITSATAYDDPTIGQIHGLTASEIASAITYDDPTCTEVDTLTASEITSATTFEDPTAGHIHNLTASEITSTTTFEDPTIGQIHALTASEITCATTFEDPTLAEAGGVDELTASEITCATTFEDPTIGQIHALTASEITSATTFEDPTLTHIHNLSASEIASAVTFEDPTAAHIHNLSASEITSATTFEDPTIGQIHGLTASEIASAAVFDDPSLGIPDYDNLTASEIACAVVFDEDFVLLDFVPETDRTWTIDAETRSLTVAAETRALEVAADDRSMVIEENGITP